MPYTAEKLTNKLQFIGETINNEVYIALDGETTN